jgi:hypothetical protein
MQWGTTSTTGHTIDEATRAREREWLAARAAPRWRLAALSFAGAWAVSVVAASWLLLRPEPEPEWEVFDSPGHADLGFNAPSPGVEIPWTPTPSTGDTQWHTGNPASYAADPAWPWVDPPTEAARIDEHGAITITDPLCTHADLIRMAIGNQRECMGIGDDGVSFVEEVHP